MAKTSKQFLDDIAALAANLRQTIDAGVDGFDPDPQARLLRVRQAENDFGFFKRTYFPHYVKSANSVLHDYLDARLPQMVAAPTGQRDVIAAPRGEAKSTLVAKLFVLWCVITERKHYACIVMDAFEQAAEQIESIKAELEANPRLAMDFPQATGAGRVWRAGLCITANNRKIEGFGAGKRIRGRSHGPHRVDLVVCDDIENDENTAQVAQRDKLERYVTKAILSLGAADDSMDVILIGTILHYDSVLSRFLRNPLWRRKVFKAIITWPSRMDLWDRFEELLLNSGDDPDVNEAAARQFYARHQAEMDQGAVTSWPAVRPLVQLMIKRARDGHDAFDSEQQNDPVSGDDAPFANCIQFWVNRLASWLFFGAVDPSLGKKKLSNDPSAILVGGFNRETGVLNVVEALIRRRVPDKIVQDIIAQQREYHCLLWMVEIVQFQQMLQDLLLKEAIKAGVPMPARGITPHTDKDLRIESLQPYLKNGQILLHPSQSTLIGQLKHWPKADHDDGPDCLEMLWKAATAGFGSMEVQSSGLLLPDHAINLYGDYALSS